jgi:hypothetical protein
MGLSFRLGQVLRHGRGLASAQASALFRMKIVGTAIASIVANVPVMRGAVSPPSIYRPVGVIVGSLSGSR